MPTLMALADLLDSEARGNRNRLRIGQRSRHGAAHEHEGERNEQQGEQTRANHLKTLLRSRSGRSMFLYVVGQRAQ